jgi:hypothetical protein
MKHIAASLMALSALFAVSCATPGSTSSSVKPYTKDMCALSDNKLGSMGPVVTKVYGNQEVKFCCQPCVKKFEKNLADNLAAL